MMAKSKASLDNLTPFDSERAKRAAAKSAEARHKGKLVARTFKLREEQAEWLSKQKNASETIRTLIDNLMLSIDKA